LEHVPPPFVAWETLYVIVGYSAAALTGLQFVVIVLGAEVGALGGAPATRAFATPTIVHFCAVLLVSAILSAPWPSLSSAALVLGVGGLLGVLYGLRVITHARRQTAYATVLEDWLFHGVLPVLAYATLLAAAVFLGPCGGGALRGRRQHRAAAAGGNPQRLGRGDLHGQPQDVGAGRKERSTGGYPSRDRYPIGKWLAKANSFRNE